MFDKVLQVFLEKLILPIICIVAGIMFGQWYKSKREAKKRTESVIAEKKVPVCNEALQRVSPLASLLIQDTLEGCLRYVLEQEKWFWDNTDFRVISIRNQKIKGTEFTRIEFMRKGYDFIDNFSQ